RCGERAPRHPGVDLRAPPGERRAHAGAVAGGHVPARHDAGARARACRRSARAACGGAMSLTSELSGSRAASLRAWLELTKPRIVSLVLFTGLPALLLAARGWPEAQVTWGALIGIALSAASAASFNHYFDRDIDALMRRTRTRPLPSGALPPVA